jgi:hypothetical protein
MIISPSKRTWPFFWTIFNSFHPRMICTKFDWIWLAGSGEDCFKCKQMQIWFSLLWPSRPTGTMIWTNLNLHYIRKLSCKYELFWLCGSWAFCMTPTPFLHFCNYLPFEEDLALNLNNLEFPLSKHNLCQVWLKLACWFWTRRFFLFKHM